MADHAAIETADASGLADRVWRKVVVVHEPLLRLLRFDRVDELRRFRTAQRERGEDVRRTAVEDAGPVKDRRDAAGARRQRSYLVHAAAVRSHTAQDRAAMNGLVDLALKEVAGVRFRETVDRADRLRDEPLAKLMEVVFPLTSRKERRVELGRVRRIEEFDECV